MKKSIKIIIQIFTLLLFIFSFYNSYANNNIKAVNGVLDLSSYDLSEIGPLKLNGQWEFYWNKLLTTDDFKKGQIEKTGYIIVPGVWNNTTLNGTKLNGQGYGTYRLRIKLKDTSHIIGFNCQKQETAYNLWVNGKLLISSERTCSSK